MPDGKTTYWLGRLSDIDLVWCLRFSSMPTRVVRHLEKRQVRRELREAAHRYCAFRAFAPGEQELIRKWTATFRQSELVRFDRRHRAHGLARCENVEQPIAVLAVGWRREPIRRPHEHHHHP